MGGRMKVVWPQGKHLKPLPAALVHRAPPVQLPSTADLIKDQQAYKTTPTDPRTATAPLTPARLRDLLAPKIRT